MAYVKLPVCAVDYALGYQTVEIARGNTDAHFTAWALRHGTSEQIFLAPPTRGNPPSLRALAPSQQLGHHNDTRIPRDMVRFTVSTSTPLFSTPEIAATPSWFVRAVSRLGVGVYRIEVSGLATFWGEASPIVDSSTPCRYALTRSVYSNTPSSPPAIVVNCYDISGGSFGPVDSSFTLSIYGTPQ